MIAVGQAGAGLVSFIGAGPGDPDLITLKGLRRLREADVIVHDRLVPMSLLAEARRGAEIIDGGKTPGRRSPTQDAINRLLVVRARAGRRVARLKGGDPAIFGRLAEEVREVRAAGVPFEIVPGVTAATAAAARAGISLTERGAASMVVFATGAAQTGGVTGSLDWRWLARAPATLVFYMVVRGLEVIAGTLVACGRDPDDPALIAEHLGTVEDRIVVIRLADLAGRGRSLDVVSPAVLITGPTVAAAMAALEASRLRTDAPGRLAVTG